MWILTETGRRARRVRGATAALTVAVAVTAAALPATAGAEERICRETIGAETLDDVKVPPDATCNLRGTLVKGNVRVERGATLNASGAEVVGNVQGENAADVTVGSSRIGGSVEVKQGVKATVSSSRVGMNILFDEDRGAVNAIDNTVGGNIQAFKNTGGVTISRNRVNGNLQCKENSPAPTGSGNVVQGTSEDQCASLTAPGAPGGQAPPGGQGQPPAADRQAPSITSFQLRRAKRRTIEVVVTTSEGGQATLTLTRRVSGRTRTLRTVQRTLRAGRTSFRIKTDGRGRALKSGLYGGTVRVRDAAGNLSASKTARVGLT